MDLNTSIPNNNKSINNEIESKFPCNVLSCGLTTTNLQNEQTKNISISDEELENLSIDELKQKIQQSEAILELKKYNLTQIQDERVQIVSELANVQKLYTQYHYKTIEASNILNHIKEIKTDADTLSVANHNLFLVRAQRNEYIEKHTQKVNERDQLTAQFVILKDEITSLTSTISLYRERLQELSSLNEHDLNQGHDHKNENDNLSLDSSANDDHSTNNETSEIQASELNNNNQSKGSLISSKLDHYLNAIKSKVTIAYEYFNRRRSLALLCLLFAPALIVLGYCLFFYDNMYICKATFTIQSNNADKVTDLSTVSLFHNSSNKDLFVAAAYIKSLDLFNTLEKKLKLIDHYSSHDLISRLAKNPTQSEIENYWNSIISIKFDSESDVLEFSVRAYSPEYAHLIATNVLAHLEKLVNSMNQKILTDSLKLASDAVEKAKEQVQFNAENLRIFRNKNAFIDPKVEISNLLNLVGHLESTIATTRAEYNQKKNYLREDSVELIALGNKITSLEDELANIRQRLAQPNVTKDLNSINNEMIVSTDTNDQGESNTTSNSNLKNVQKILSNSLNDYEKLNLEYEFSQKLLESALSSLEETRQLSLSKNKYLVTIDAPKLPNESLWPKPFVASIITFIFTFFSLSALSLLSSAIKEHLGI